MLALLLAVGLQIPIPYDVPSDSFDKASPDGRYRVEVEPSDRYGRGPSSVRCTEGELELWRRELPFTLEHAGVDDAGRVFGYGVHGEELVVTVIDRDGEAVLEDRHPREPRRDVVSFGKADPLPVGLIEDLEHDQFWLRVVDRRQASIRERWWPYDLRMLERGETVVPEEVLGLTAFNSYGLAEVQPVRGTELLLVRYAIGRTSGTRTEKRRPRDGVFTLVDCRAEPVWTIHLPGAYRRSEKLEERWIDELLRRHGALRDLGPGRFGIWETKTETLHRYEVQRTDSAWSVTELESAALAVDLDRLRGPAPEPLALEELESVPLEGLRGEGEPMLRDVVEWQPLGDGRIGWFRRRSDGSLIYEEHSSEEGLLDAWELDAFPYDDESGESRWIYVGERRWFRSSSSGATQGLPPARDARLHRIDASRREIESVDHLRIPDWPDHAFRIHAVQPLEDGDLVVLGEQVGDSSCTAQLVRFNARGWPVWEVPADPEALPRIDAGVEHMVVLSAFEVLVGHHVYGLDGGRRRTVRALDSRTKFGERPFLRAPNGLVLTCAHSSRWLKWIDPVTRKAEPQAVPLEEGHLVEALAASYRLDQAGAVWGDDGHWIFRVDPEGRVERWTSSFYASDELVWPARPSVLGGGRVALLDRETGAPHVWGEGGRRIFVGEPAPDRPGYPTNLVSGPRGTAVAPDWGRGVHTAWDVEGRRIELTSKELGAVRVTPFDPLDSRGIFGDLLPPIEEEHLPPATVERLVDGRWVVRRHSDCLAPNGDTLALVEVVASSGRDPVELVRFAPDGRELSSIPARRGGSLAATSEWVAWRGDGSVFLMRADETTLFEAEIAQASRVSAVGFSDDGKRLLALTRRDGPAADYVLRRFELPASGGD